MALNRAGICTDVQIIPASREHHRYQAVVRCLVDGELVDLLKYFDDELSFAPSDFEGRSVAAAIALFMQRDKAYLQS